jgi:hypothetical protein
MRMTTIAGALVLGLAACSPQADPLEQQLFELAPELPAAIGAVDGPSLHIARRTVDFGTVWKGSVREVVYPLISAGTEPLHITRVNASCGCTLVEALVVAADGTSRPLVYDEDLAPGTRVEIVARFDSRKFEGYEKKTVEVYSDDPQGGHSLEMGVVVEPWLLVDHDTLHFDRIYPAQPVVRSAKITSKSGQPFGLTFTPTRVLPSGVSMELTSNAEAGQERATEWTLSATINSDSNTGHIMVPILLESDEAMPNRGPVSPEQSSGLDLGLDSPRLDVGEIATTVRPKNHFLDLGVVANVLPPLAPDKVYLSFGFLRPGAVTSDSARIECFDPKLAAAFLEQIPTVELTDANGEPLEHASAFTPTLRRITPEDQPQTSPSRALLPGALGAWDLEVAARGFSGAGENRLMGRAEVTFGGGESILLTFQVILQP